MVYQTSSATLIPAAAQAYEVEDRGTLGDRADFMGSGATGQADYWITPEAYHQIYRGLAPPAASGSANAHIHAAAAHQKMLFYEGVINASGVTKVQPWYTSTITETLTDSTGTLSSKRSTPLERCCPARLSLRSSTFSPNLW